MLGLDLKTIKKLVNAPPLHRIPKKLKDSHPYRLIYRLSQATESQALSDPELRKIFEEIGPSYTKALIDVHRDYDDFVLSWEGGASHTAYRLLRDYAHKLKPTFDQLLRLISTLRYHDVYKNSGWYKKLGMLVDDVKFYSALFEKLDSLECLSACYCYVRYAEPNNEEESEALTTCLNIMCKIVEKNSSNQEIYDLACEYYTNILANCHLYHPEENGFALWMACASFKSRVPSLDKWGKLVKVVEKGFRKKLISEDSVGGYESFILHWKEGEELVLRLYKEGHELITACPHCAGKLPREYCKKVRKNVMEKEKQTASKMAEELLASGKFEEALDLVNIAISSCSHVVPPPLKEIRKQCYFSLGRYVLALLDHRSAGSDDEDFVARVSEKIPKARKEVAEMLWSREYHWDKPKLMKTMRYSPHSHEHIHVPGAFIPLKSRHPTTSYFVNNNTCFTIEMIDTVTGKSVKRWGKFTDTSHKNVYGRVGDLCISRLDGSSVLMCIVSLVTYEVRLFRVDEQKKTASLLCRFASGCSDLNYNLFLGIRCVPSERVVIVTAGSLLHCFKCSSDWKSAKKMKSIPGYSGIIRIEVHRHSLFVACTPIGKFRANKIMEFDTKDDFKNVKGYVKRNILHATEMSFEERTRIRCFGVNSHFVVAGFDNGTISIFKRNQSFEKYNRRLLNNEKEHTNMVTDLSIEEKSSLAVVGFNDGHYFVVDCVTANVLFRSDFHNKQPGILEDKLNCILASQLYMDKKRNFYITTAGFGDMKIAVHRINVIAKRCGVCGKKGKLLKCSKCKKMYYCGRECQLNDWKIHKKACRRTFV